MDHDDLTGASGTPTTEVLYRLLAESVRDYAIFALDADGRVLTWSRGAEEIKGYTAEEVVGEHYRMFYPADARAQGEPERQLEVAAREGRFEGEGWRVRKDGTRFWVRAVITALSDSAGRVIGFGKVTSDMTTERRAQIELRERERQLAEAQQIAHLGSWEWRAGDEGVQWSEELFRIYGIEPTGKLGYDRYLELVHPDDRAEMATLVERTLETGESFVHEHRLIRPTGEVRWLQARGEVVRDETGRIARLHGTALDITELKEAEQQARRLVGEQSAREEAERTAQRMGFLAEASALVGGSLDYEETLRTVAWLAVPSFADWCAVDMLGPDGVLNRLAVAHIDPERAHLAIELEERYPDDPAATHGVRRVLRTGEAELLEEFSPELVETAAADDEHLRLIQQLGLRSAIVVPIQVRDRPLGAITFVSAESERRYTGEDLVVARELAGRAALAIENTQLHMAEREARQRAEQATERMARLQEITAGLSEAVTPEAVAAVIVDQGVAALGARTGVLGLVENEGDVRLVRSHGLPDAVVEAYRQFDVTSMVPVAEAIRTGAIVLVGNPAEGEARYPALEGIRRSTGSRAVAGVPLRSADRIIGGLGFGYVSDREFTDDDRAFLEALGRQCAQALERAWLFEMEHLAREAAEAASLAKTQFVAMMSHELRTPLSAILGYEELLSEGIVGPVTGKQKQQLARIRASAAHLRDLINQVLSLSRIEAGKEDVSLEAVDLGGLTRDVALLMEREIEAKGLELETRTPTEPVILETDPGKVRQILLNLISNAVKFTDDGGVQVELERTADMAILRVCDTGPGIAKSDQERIFEEFTQIDQSMTRRVGGTGLGLPVSRRLAGLLGGSLELNSEIGMGSAFELRLPLGAWTTATEPAAR